jgi:hypothetical protein
MATPDLSELQRVTTEAVSGSTLDLAAVGRVLAAADRLAVEVGVKIHAAACRGADPAALAEARRVLADFEGRVDDLWRLVRSIRAESVAGPLLSSQDMGSYDFKAP